MRRTPPRLWRLAAALSAGAATACAHCGDVVPPAAAPTARQAAAAGRGTALAPTPCPPHASLTARGTCVPDAWHCSPSYYAARDGCDCDCGAVDPDCGGTPAQFFCYNAGSPSPVPNCAACAVTPPASPPNVDLAP